MSVLSSFRSVCGLTGLLVAIAGWTAGPAVLAAPPADGSAEVETATAAPSGEAAPDAAAKPAEDTGYSETVTVTASRTPLTLDETGSSITVIDRQRIEQRQSSFVGDLLRGVPGVALSRSGPAGALTQVRLRGAEANQTLVLIDGIAVNDAFAGDEIPLELLTAYDLDAIEVIRGPQSGLWGADALAGAINILTPRPDPEAGPEVELEAGAFGTVRAAGRFNVGGPGARLGVSASYLETDGTNISRQGDENDGSRNGTATLRFGWDARRRPVGIEIVGRHTDASAAFDTIDFASTGLPVDDDRTTDTELALLGATARWTPAGSPLRHELRASLASSDTESFAAATSTGSTALDKLAASLQSSVALGRSGSKLEHDLTFAVDHETREFRQRGEAMAFGDPNQDQRLTSTGAVLEYRLRVPRRWSLSASARHDRNSDFGDVTTYRVTALHHGPGERTRLRASAGSGHKPPTFIERYGFFADTFVGNPRVEPELSTEWEVGFDRRVARRSWLELTYFRGRLEDEINGFFFDPGLGVFTARNETGVSHRQGAELAFRSSLGERLQLGATYTYTDATEPGAGGADERELRRPRHMGSAGVRFRAQRIPFDMLVHLAYTGSQVDRFFPPFPQPSQRVDLEAYVLADVTARYRIGKRLELFGRIENALDERYEDVFGFATPGVGAYLGLRLHAAP